MDTVSSQICVQSEVGDLLLKALLVTVLSWNLSALLIFLVDRTSLKGTLLITRSKKEDGSTARQNVTLPAQKLKVMSREVFFCDKSSH